MSNFKDTDMFQSHVSRKVRRQRRAIEIERKNAKSDRHMQELISKKFPPPHSNTPTIKVWEVVLFAMVFAVGITLITHVITKC